MSHARAAIREFDGANANGQPIRLTLLPSGPSRGRNSKDGASRNPFDTAVKPGRSLFDRIEEPRGGRDRGRDRSRSPGAPRRTDTRKPPPENIDRYVPSDEGARLSRSRSPARRPRMVNGGRRDGGRDSTDRRGDARRGTRGGRGDSGRMMVGGRPRMTQEELDQEM